jgi:hypothetical protein
MRFETEGDTLRPLFVMAHMDGVVRALPLEDREPEPRLAPRGATASRHAIRRALSHCSAHALELRDPDQGRAAATRPGHGHVKGTARM